MIISRVTIDFLTATEVVVVVVVVEVVVEEEVIGES